MKINDCNLIEPFICRSDDTVESVAKKLRTTTLRHIFVVDDNDYPVGIISVMDINNRVVAEGKDAKAIKAHDIMSRPIDIVEDTDDALTTVKNMIKHNRVMNAVVADNKIKGIITLNELIKRCKVDKHE